MAKTYRSNGKKETGYAASSARYEKKSDQASLTIQKPIETISDMLKREIAGEPIGRRPINYMPVSDVEQITEFYRPIFDPHDVRELKRHVDAVNKQYDELQAHLQKPDTPQEVKDHLAEVTETPENPTN
jgi:hypothetical protein